MPVGGLLAPERAPSPRRRRDHSSGGGLVPRACNPPRTPPNELNALDGDELWDGEDDHLEHVYEPYPSNWNGLDQLAWEAAVAAGWEDEEDEGDGEWQRGAGEHEEGNGQEDGYWQEGDGQENWNDPGNDGDRQGGDGQEDGGWPEGDGDGPNGYGEEDEEEEEE